MTELTILSDLDLIEEAIIRIIEDIRNSVPREELIYDIRLIISEIMINAHLHGNKQDGNKSIHVCFTCDEEHFHVRIRDEGEGFDPNLVPNPLSLENLEKPSGRGLFLVSRVAQTVCYHGMGNDVEIVKWFNR